MDIKGKTIKAARTLRSVILVYRQTSAGVSVANTTVAVFYYFIGTYAHAHLHNAHVNKTQICKKMRLLKKGYKTIFSVKTRLILVIGYNDFLAVL